MGLAPGHLFHVTAVVKLFMQSGYCFYQCLSVCLQSNCETSDQKFVSLDGTMCHGAF